MVQLVLQHCCKTSREAMLCVLLATYKPTLQRIKVFAGCENLLLCMLHVLQAQGKLVFYFSK